MHIADYILNNNDRHEQNWGFLMENETGKLIGFCPLFDHDHAFANYDHVMSQTTECEMSLKDAAVSAGKQLGFTPERLYRAEQPMFLTGKQWEAVLERGRSLSQALSGN